MTSSRDNIVNAHDTEEATMAHRTFRIRTPRARAAAAGKEAGYWGRQALANIRNGLEVEAIRVAARSAAHHYRRREELLGRGGYFGQHSGEANTMSTTKDRLPDTTAHHYDPPRLSWEAATDDELEDMRVPELRAYNEERGIRAIALIYIGNVRDEAGEAGVDPTDLLAAGAVARIAGILGAISASSTNGRPRVLVDDNAVAYYGSELRSHDGQLLGGRPPFIVDPLLVKLAEALGCRWTWVEDTAIELVR